MDSGAARSRLLYTSFRAELLAVWRAMCAADGPLAVYTDCKSLVKRQAPPEVPHADLWCRILDLCKERLKHFPMPSKTCLG